MKSKSMKIMTFLTVVLLTILFMGMVCATTTDNNMDTSNVDTISDVTQTNHDKQSTMDNIETGIKTENNDKINEADTTTKTINKNTDNTASKAVTANVTYSGEDTDTYEKVKNLIETNDDAQELIIELNKDKTYTITEPITFGTQTNTKTLTINGCNAIIDGNKTQSFITVLSGYTLNLNTITIQNTRADNGAAIYSDGTVNINDATFKDNSALYRGGAVYSSGTLTVNRSKFTDNKVTTTQKATEKDYGGGAILTRGALSVDNSSFNGNKAEYDTAGTQWDAGMGGAILIYNNTNDVSITNSQFTENKANYGGAIKIYDPQNRNKGNIIIDSNIFNKNRAYEGGALSLEHSTIVTNNNFIENVLNKLNVNLPSVGGAIVIYDEKIEKTYTLTLSDNIFNANNAGQGYGGAVVSLGMIQNSSSNVFENNKALFGGAIFNLGYVTSVDDIFTDNSALYRGGAIGNPGNATITNDTFTNNNALYTGGAIDSTGTLTVNRSKFNNNKVTTTKKALEKDYGGGAILTRGALSVDNSSFNGNKAEYDTAGTLWDAGIGGAIFIYNNTDDVSITNSQFTANEAGYGGAVMTYDPLYRDKGNIVIDSNIFNKNSAYEGGALSLQHSTIVTNNNFTENTINQNVNAPFAGAAIVIYDDKYEKTYTLTLSDNIFNANDAGNKGLGGAIEVGTNMVLYSSDNIYENNKARYGGAISNMGNATSADDVFTDNSAVYRGGAILSDGRLDISSSQFIDNKVTTSKNAAKEDYGGGAIFTRSTLTVDNSVFRGNVATHDNIESADDGSAAGAIYIFNNTDVVIITNSNFTENDAAMGGAILINDPLYRNEGKILIDNNIFNKNHAIQAGAISTLQSVNITNNKFIKNSVYYDENYLKPTSGAILLYNSMEMNDFTVNLINNTFSENSADMGNSGAICVSDNFILNSKNNIYENNKAVEGGVIINVGSATFTNDIFTGNTATDNGGVFLNHGNLTIINCTFKDNTAKEHGDLVYTLNDMTISDSTINTDNLERLITAYADIFASDNIVNGEFLKERLINSTLTLEKRDLILNKENTIAGILIDATDVPIVNATVSLAVNEIYYGSAVTDENGGFTFKYTPRKGTSATLGALFDPVDYYLISVSDTVEVKIVNNDTNNTPQPKPVPKVKPATTKTTKNAKKITQANTHTIRLASDNKLVYTGNALTLEALNKIFDLNFTNGRLLVYIDGILVFNDTTTDDISQVILEILDKYLGEHEIKVVFTDNQNQTNTYKENIIIE